MSSIEDEVFLNSDANILIISAEASSVLYAQRIIEAFQNQKFSHFPDGLKFFGVGSREMEALGFERLGNSEEMAIVGVSEVISHYSFLKSIFNKILDEVKKRRPKVAILLDYPEFNLMLARRLKEIGIPVVYYISPQIWAWRQGRVHKMKKYCSKVLLIFPFEIDFYKRHEVPYQFVGHPILDELDERYFEKSYFHLRRSQCGIKDDEIVIGLMPGSRRHELSHHFSIQLEVAHRLLQKYQNVKILIMCAPNFDKQDLLPYLENVKFPFIILNDDPFKMIHLTNFVLVASGTATLMVGLLKKPMVIMYRMKWMSYLLAKILVKSRFFGLVNLVLNKEVVPEKFQNEASVENLTQLMSQYIDDPQKAKKVREELGGLHLRLGQKGATLRVVECLKEFIH